MWLASLSLRDARGRIACCRNWCRSDLKLGGKKVKPVAILHWLLKGLGDPEKERLFRMNITLCLHRGVREDEIASLPSCWKEAGTGIAGGPVEILWERGCKGGASTKPCENPEKMLINEKRPDLWIPIDCGKCEPCRARKAIEESWNASRLRSLQM